MGACTEATLAPHAATAAHRRPLTEPRRRHRPSPAVTGRRPLSHAASLDPSEREGWEILSSMYLHLTSAVRFSRLLGID